MKPRSRQSGRRSKAKSILKLPSGTKAPAHVAASTTGLKSSANIKRRIGSGDLGSLPVDIEKLVQIEKPIYGGAFLARVAGKSVFVPLALPGEEARVRIVEEKKNYASGEAEEIVRAAAERIAPACPYFGFCGGCQYQHASYEAQLRFKHAILRETLERAGVRAPQKIAVLAGEPWAYRNRIRLAFDAAGDAGYRGRRSHAVVPIAQCPIAAPLLVRAARAAAEVARRFAPVFQPTEISLFCDGDESALLVSILAASAAKGRWDDFARALIQQVPEVKGIELLAGGRASQSPRTVSQWGETSLSYRAAGFAHRVDHGAFFQVNRWLVDSLAERVSSSREGALAWDLFAGVGLFARRLATSFARVIAVESAPAAIAALAHNLSGTNAVAVQASALEFLSRADRSERPDLIVPNLIIVDPPRAGLGAETATLLARAGAAAIVYVSCDPATLARDLRALIAAGYMIEGLTLADLFPQTFHIETIAELRRPRSNA